LTYEVVKQNPSQKQLLAMVGRLPSLQGNKGNKLYLQYSKQETHKESSGEAVRLGNLPGLSNSERERTRQTETEMETGLKGVNDMIQGLCA
jgi:hypothetical protein